MKVLSSKSREGVFNIRDYGALGFESAVTAVAATNLFTTSLPHGFRAGQRVAFATTATIPGGLSVLNVYFVIASGLTATTFKVSTTLAGTEVDVTSAGSGTHTVYADDSAAFSAAFAAMQAAARGGTIWVPPGTFNVAANVTAFNGLNAGSSFAMVGAGSASVVRIINTYSVSWVFQIANIDSLARISRMTFIGQTGLGIDASQVLQFAGCGKVLVERCHFYGLRCEGLSSGAVVKIGASFAEFWNTNFHGCSSEKGVVWSEGGQLLTIEHGEFRDVGDINGTAIVKTTANSPWIRMTDVRATAHGSPIRSCLKIVDTHLDEGPNVGILVENPTSGRRLHELRMSNVAQLVPAGRGVGNVSAVRAEGVERVHIDGHYIGVGGGAEEANDAYRFEDCGIIELLHCETYNGTPPNGADGVYADADCRVLVMRNCVGFDAPTGGCPVIEIAGEESRPVRATRYSAAVTDNDTWTDLADGEGATTIPCASGASVVVVAHVVVRSTKSTETTPSTHTLRERFETAAQNVSGTVTLQEDPGVVALGTVGGFAYSVQAVVVAGSGLKLQAKIATDASYSHAATITAHVEVYAA